jgi:hypothetical protein
MITINNLILNTMNSNFTKKALLFSFFGLAVTTMSAQQLKKIGGNPYLIEGSAVFEIESTDRGFLMPRMTTTQRTAIATPAAGLQVYDTVTKTIWNYDGTSWIDLLTKLTGVVTSDGNATSFGTFASSALSAAVNDETGTGSLVLASSPTFTGTVAGIDKTMVGLANVDNTTDALKPISTATQDALDLKANVADVTTTADLNTALDLKADLDSPTLVTPVLGAATATTINKLTLTEPANGATLSLADNSLFITAGAFSQTLIATATTSVTLPTTGTLATTDDLKSAAKAITAVKTAAYTALVTDYTILANTNGGTFELTLPDPTANEGKVYVISKRDDGTISLTFSPSVITADGVIVTEMNYPTTLRIQSNGTSWLIIN